MKLSHLIALEIAPTGFLLTPTKGGLLGPDRCKKCFFILGRLLFCLISLLDFEFLFLIQTKKVCCAPTGFNIWANLVPNKHFVQPDLNQDSVKGGKREGNSSYNHNAEVCKKKTLFICQRRWKMVQSMVI